MFDRMTRGIPLKRPICREILNEIQIWSLDEKELTSTQKVETVSFVSNLCYTEENIAFCL